MSPCCCGISVETLCQDATLHSCTISLVEVDSSQIGPIRFPTYSFDLEISNHGLNSSSMNACDSLPETSVLTYLAVLNKMPPK